MSRYTWCYPIATLCSIFVYTIFKFLTIFAVVELLSYILFYLFIHRQHQPTIVQSTYEYSGGKYLW